MISSPLFSLFKMLIFLLMALYALLKDLRDVLWTKIFGFKAIALFKYTSLFSSILFWILFSYMHDNKKLPQAFLSVISFYTLFFACSSILLFFYEPLLFVSHPYVSISVFIFYVVLEAFPVFVYGLFWGLVDYIAKKEDSRDRYPTLIFISEWGGLLALYCVYKSLLKQYINSFFALFFIIFLLFSFVAIGAYVIKRYFSHFYILGEDKEELEKNTWQEMRDNVKLSLTTGIPLFIFLVVFIGECYNVALHFLKLEILGKDAMTHDAILMYLAHLYETSFFSYMIGFLISFFFARYAYVAFSIKRKIILIFLFLFLISFCCLFSHHAFIMIALSVLFKSFQRTSLFSLKENLLLFVDHSKRVAFKVFVESFAGRMGKFFMATLLAFMYGFFIKAQLFFYFVLFSSLAFVFLLSGLFFTRKKD